MQTPVCARTPYSVFVEGSTESWERGSAWLRGAAVDAKKPTPIDTRYRSGGRRSCVGGRRCLVQLSAQSVNY
jgi:hypothetical protein